MLRERAAPVHVDVVRDGLCRSISRPIYTYIIYIYICVYIYICYVIDAYLVHAAVVRDGAAKRSRVTADLFLLLYTPICIYMYIYVCIYDA